MKTRTIGRLAGILVILIAVTLLAFSGDRSAKASGDLDEILEYYTLCHTASSHQLSILHN